MKLFECKILKSLATIILVILAFLSHAVAAENEKPSKSAPEMLLAAQEEIKTALNEVKQNDHYTIILSNGNEPEDFDLVITRRTGNLYSFKYCKAHNPDGSPNEIALIRNIHLAQPGYFNAWNADKKEILSGYFTSANCRFIGSSQIYAHVKNYNASPVLQDSWGGPYSAGASGIAGLLFGFSTIEKLGILKHQNNTLSFSKMIFSKQAPRLSGIAAIALIGVSTKSSILWFKDDQANDRIQSHSETEKDLVAQTAGATYNFNFDSRKLEQTSLDGELVVNSMKAFVKDFSAGLNILLQKNCFRSL